MRKRKWKCEHNEEWRQKIVKRMTSADNPMHTEKARKIISQKAKLRCQDPEFRKKISDGVKRFFAEHPEARAHLSKKTTEYFNNHPEARERMSVLGKGRDNRAISHREAIAKIHEELKPKFDRLFVIDHRSAKQQPDLLGIDFKAKTITQIEVSGRKNNFPPKLEGCDEYLKFTIEEILRDKNCGINMTRNTLKP